ncbi:hypothetical protein KR026_003332, partial [Drosophila bipectinata]
AEKSINDEETVDAMSCLQDESWNASSSNSLFPFRHELSLIGSIMMRGTRIVIPKALRQAILTLAHEGHPGESAMKRRLRSKKGKEYADKRRGAKEINVEVGDKVFLKNVIFPYKLTPNFDTTEYVVKGREGDIIRITGGGKTLTRNVSHVKKIPQTQPPAETEDHSPPSRSTGDVLQPLNFRTLDESKQMESTSETPSAPGEGLKLKLINKGGMWESVPPVIS